MRRVLGSVAAVLGVFLLLVGILAKPVLYDGLATVKLNQRSVSESEGSGMSALYVHSVGGAAVFDKLEGVTLKSTRNVIGIPGRVSAAKKQDTDAFWQTTVQSQAEIDGTLTDLSFSDEGVSFNRRTGLATNCCGDYKSIGDLADPTATREVKHEGLFFKFPFDVQKKSYPWWDGDTNKAETMEYQREETLEGVKTYVFRQVTPKAEQQQFDADGQPVTREVPKSLFGDSATGDVPVKVMYGNTRTLWIEPNTGVLIKGTEELDKSLVAEGYAEVATTKGTIGYSDKTIKANAKDWGSKGRLLGLLNGIVTPLGIILGLILLALGVFLLLGSRETGPAGTRRARRAAA